MPQKLAELLNLQGAVFWIQPPHHRPTAQRRSQQDTKTLKTQRDGLKKLKKQTAKHHIMPVCPFACVVSEEGACCMI